MHPASPASALHDVVGDRTESGEALPRRRAWAAFGIALAAFVALTAVVGAVVPERAWLDAPLRAKLDVFAGEKDEIDVLVVGTSHLYRGVIPEVLDARLAERGLRVRSHNLAYSGMMAIEADGFLRQALALRPARLRWVVVELDDALATAARPNTTRMIAWHDLRGTAAALRAVSRSGRPARARAALVRRHVGAFVERTSCLGIAPEVVRLALGRESGAYHEVAAAIRPGRGFLAYDAGALPEQAADERRRRFLRDVDAYVSDVREVAGGGAVPRRKRSGRPVPCDARWLRAQIDMIRAAGAEPVFVIGPQLDPRPAIAGRMGAGASAGMPELLVFDDPARLPELFEPGSRFDRAHVNGRGAQAFTRMLADALADRVLGRPR